MELNEIAVEFEIAGAPAVIRPHGEGHINLTYYVETDKGSKYILQKINNRLFADVEALMRNIELVTTHIAKKNIAEKKPSTCLTIVKTKDGKPFYCGNGEFYRMYDYIDDAIAYQSVSDPSLFYESAVAFGAFQNYLSDFDASQLTEVLPDFHNTRKRFSDFKASLKADKAGRAASVKEEIDFVLSREKYCDRIVSMLKSGEIPLRVTHNDTKLNNVMIDAKTGKARAVIDLDTVMPGCSGYDFGDSIRFGCNSGAEDEPDLNKVYFKFDLFESYSKGYLSTLKNITKAEKAQLAFCAILMTYECGMRFLADHLDGDVYFRTKRENHNLDRARTQFKLVSDMEKQLDKMEKLIETL